MIRCQNLTDVRALAKSGALVKVRTRVAKRSGGANHSAAIQPAKQEFTNR